MLYLLPFGPEEGLARLPPRCTSDRSAEFLGVLASGPEHLGENAMATITSNANATIAAMQPTASELGPERLWVGMLSTAFKSAGLLFGFST